MASGARSADGPKSSSSTLRSDGDVIRKEGSGRFSTSPRLSVLRPDRILGKNGQCAPPQHRNSDGCSLPECAKCVTHAHFSLVQFCIPPHNLSTLTQPRRTLRQSRPHCGGILRRPRRDLSRHVQNVRHMLEKIVLSRKKGDGGTRTRSLRVIFRNIIGVNRSSMR